MNLNEEIIRLLKNEGCKIVGFADLRALPEEPRKGGDFGIIIGEPYKVEEMAESLEGKPQRFEQGSEAISDTLERYKKAVIEFLKIKGYKADYKYRNSVITHKMIGTLAGIGWIGRCAILTTREYGPTLRLTALLTNAPVACGTPITKSLGPSDCTTCADICPVNAIKEGFWEQGIHRDEFFDVKACMKVRQKRKPMCVLCISVCPFTKEGLGYE